MATKKAKSNRVVTAVLDGLPLIVKVLLIIFWSLYGGLYRIFRGIEKGKGSLIIIGILWFILGGITLFIDLISLLVYRNLRILAN